jgi:hypothetical protein
VADAGCALNGVHRIVTPSVRGRRHNRCNFAGPALRDDNGRCAFARRVSPDVVVATQQFGDVGGGLPALLDIDADIDADADAGAGAGADARMAPHPPALPAEPDCLCAA